MVTRKKPIKRRAEPAMPTKEDEEESKRDVPKDLLVIAQEVKIVRALACNDVTKRNRQVRKLRKWFKLRANSSFSFTEDDFLRIWKGLYYNMWMSDKPLVQEDLAEQLAQMVDSFDGNTTCSLAYFSAFMRVMCQEWFGIDQWRMDKFLMLVRRMLRYCLRVLKQSKWSKDLIDIFNRQMKESVLADQPKSRGMTMHYLDIFFEELAKAANGEITSSQVNLFLRPFVTYMGTQRDVKLVAQCRTRVLYHLLYQSELGREYSEKYSAWKEMGFPTASIDDVEKLDSGFDEEMDDEEDEEKKSSQLSLDPRAGNVDVQMPELPLNADAVLDELQNLLRTQDYNAKRRKGLRKIIQIFETYKSGEFPLGVREMPKPDGQTLSELIEQKVHDADKVEEEVFGTGRKLKKLNKAKRKRLLQSINFDEVDEDNYDEIINQALPAELKKKVKRNAKARKSMQKSWLVEEVKEDEQQEQTEQQETQKQRQDEEQEDNPPPKKKSKKAKTTQVQQKEEESKSNGWEDPLQAGEQEFFIPSRKEQTKEANTKFQLSTPKPNKSTLQFATPQPPSVTGSSSKKRVRIMTKCNSAYPKSDYYRQLKLSPQLPYDADRVPGKSALKPHVLPGPIHPNYKGAKRLFNDTL
ncbi:uncharacterized protein Dwil_GK15286 [Drosophila willistoni]|uniref:Ribosomal RNA processing protein 1 homolog n=1 Tax=Drosophila willistoni TaxID=7260 RepID=B4MWH3_DROWI|nr:ribosomal RNA processing protein 1 homolog [Drosophila willistoni]EDW76114.1 uncharacterized protein Dwil_GK15286 [Drosophila willistoni]